MPCGLWLFRLGCLLADADVWLCLNARPLSSIVLTPRRCLQLDPGLWEVCLQDYGIYRTSNICGEYLMV